MEKKTKVVFAYVVKAEYTGKSLSCPRHVCSTAACIGFQLACPRAAFAASGCTTVIKQTLLHVYVYSTAASDE
jgi:hypothetical protein